MQGNLASSEPEKAFLFMLLTKYFPSYFQHIRRVTAGDSARASLCTELTCCIYDELTTHDISGFPFPTMTALLSSLSDIPHSWFCNCYIDLHKEENKLTSRSVGPEFYSVFGTPEFSLGQEIEYHDREFFVLLNSSTGMLIS